MVNVEKYNLKWNDFETGLLSGFQDIRKCEEFFDVTLVCDDNQIKAHKMVLSACSPFFRHVLNENPHPSPLIYLRGVSYQNLVATLNFMYCGEVNISQDTLSDFLSTAEDFKVKGLSQSNNGEAAAGQSRTNSRNSTAPSAVSSRAVTPKPAAGKNKRSAGDSLSAGGGGGGGGNSKKVKVTNSSRGGAVLLQSEAAEGEQEEGGSGGVGVKAELNYIPSDVIEITNTSQEANDKALDIVDHSLGEGEEDFASYEEDYGDYSEITEDQGTRQSKGYSLGTVYRPGSESTKKNRQKIISFITLHKLKLDNFYMCSLCNKQSADNSNMNKHIEFTHALELQNFLSGSI